MEFVFDPEIDLEYFVEEDWAECFCEANAAKLPGVKKDGHKSPPKGYPTEKSLYADPTNYAYPLDTEKHVRAALAYFSKPKNREKYSSDEQSFIWARILKAAKKYGIEVQREESKGDQHQEVDEMEEKLMECKEMLKEMKMKMDDMKGKGESQAEIETLKTALASFESQLKEIAAKLEPAKPLISQEEIDALKAEVASAKQAVEEGKAAKAELEAMKLEKLVATRLGELETSGLRFAETAGTAQAEKVKTMTDEQFGSYKADLLLVKEQTAKLSKTEKSKAEIEAEDKKKLLDLASKETGTGDNPYKAI